MAVGIENIYSFYLLYDACIEADIPFYLGYPYYIKSIHDGKKKNDRIDSKKIADLMISNHLPIGYPYPYEMKATRDLLRRRHRLVRLRSECYTHIQSTFSQHGILDVNHSWSNPKRPDESSCKDLMILNSNLPLKLIWICV